MSNVLSVRDLKVSFASEAGRVDAVRGVTFDLHRGDYVPDERCIAVGVRIMCAAALQAIDAANGIRAK